MTNKFDPFGYLQRDLASTLKVGSWTLKTFRYARDVQRGRKSKSCMARRLPMPLKPPFDQVVILALSLNAPNAIWPTAKRANAN
ncbi:hypothetical protein [Rhizobium lusitanum]|uniref:hypothetical protein n=1 Tax=Rhizobium lusitanum TaxID=293958 RepID=UPI0025746F8A|nr:hypothetical protein [Rhizobium lusitanum]